VEGFFYAATPARKTCPIRLLQTQTPASPSRSRNVRV
jgi:hypothetical protein